jgi:hypothetical protein
VTGSRPRRSTAGLAAAFILVFALYLWVRPDPQPDRTRPTTTTTTTVAPPPTVVR